MSEIEESKELKKKKSIDMLHGPLWGKILLFALPLAVTGILQQLFNAADIAVVGQFVGKNAMAAVGSCSPFIGLLINAFVGLSLGANVVIAKFTGQKDDKGVHHAVHTSLILAVIVGLLIAVIGELITNQMMTLLSVPESVQSMTKVYLRIYFIATPFIALYNFESAIFRSQGNTKTPLIALAISGIINVCLNLVFVIGVGMDVSGVALATLIANVISSTILFIFLTKDKGRIRVHVKMLKIDARVLKQIVRIGLPAALQLMVFSISNIMVQSAINSLGADVIAGSSAAFNVEIITYYVLSSFGQACTTFVGQNYGAKQIKRCGQVLKTCLILDAVISFTMNTLVVLAAVPLLHIFNSDPAVVAAGLVRYKILISTQTISLLIEVISGYMRGFGKSLVPAIITFVGVCVFRIIYVYTVFASFPTFKTLMYAYPISWSITSVIFIVMAIVTHRRMAKKYPEC